MIGAGPDGVTFEPGSNWGRTTGRAVRFVLNPPIHRHDAGAVWLWLADQAAPARAVDINSSRPRSEYVGKISRWHVYFLASANALAAWPAAKEDVTRALDEAAAPAGGRQAARDARDARDDDYYRGLHDRNKAEVLDAAKAGKGDELSARTAKFNESIAGKLLYAQVVSRVGPTGRHVTLLSKSFGDRKIAVGKIHFPVGDKPYVERSADGEGYVLIATNPLEGGKWPDDLQITLVMEPAAAGGPAAATRPAARPKPSLKISSDRTAFAAGEDVSLTIAITNLTADSPPAPETYWSARLALDGKEYKRLPEFVGDWDGPAGIIPGGDFRTGLSLSEYGVPPAAPAAGERKVSVRVAGDESNVLDYIVREPAAPAGGGRPGAAARAGVPDPPAGGQQQRELRGPVTEIHPTVLENEVWLDLKGRLVRSEQGYAYVAVDANGACRLSLASTPTHDLSHLKGAPLESLDLSNTAVEDLSPLARMPLRVLDVSGSRVRDLSPLKGMKLKTLRMSNTRVGNLSPLEDVGLTELDAASTPVADLSALARMPLAYLDVRRTAVKDLAPLAGTPLSTLRVEDTEVKDLLPLRKTQLRTLTIRGRKGMDLSQLNGVPLTSMTLSGTEVTDLSPLRGMKLESLQLVDTGVQDLAPSRRCRFVAWV